MWPDSTKHGQSREGSEWENRIYLSPKRGFRGFMPVSSRLFAAALILASSTLHCFSHCHSVEARSSGDGTFQDLARTGSPFGIRYKVDLDEIIHEPYLGGAQLQEHAVLLGSNYAGSL